MKHNFEENITNTLEKSADFLFYKNSLQRTLRYVKTIVLI